MIANRLRPAVVFTTVVFLFLLFIPPCFAQIVEEKEDPALARAAGRPKVGLVLSGGGARGVAHVGVLKVLEELRVPVDFIAGTSMGSLVGGIYASGMSPDEMEKRIAAIDWAAIFRDDPARKDIPWRQKRDDYTDLFGLELGFRDGKTRRAPGDDVRIQVRVSHDGVRRPRGRAGRTELRHSPDPLPRRGHGSRKR